MVTEKRIRSQKNPDATTTHVRRVPQRTCMKKRMTSSALMQAMVSITTLFSAPRSMNATATVSPVPDQQRGENLVVEAFRCDVAFRHDRVVTRGDSGGR